jgi:N-methylhydantoinase A/oxoprolinase/acetone carboxylase beta subunit
VLDAFEQLHRQRYGYSHDGPIELLTIRVNLSTEKIPFVLPQLIKQPHCNNIRHCKVYGETEQARLLARADMYPGESIEGPAVITEYSATTFVATNWSVAVDGFGNLLLQKKS